MLNFFQSSKLELFLYIFNTVVKKFLSVAGIFCCVLYIFEILKLFEYLAQGVNFTDWVVYLSVDFFTFLPIILPVSLLISILIVYNILFINNEFLLSHILNLKFFFYPILTLSAFVFLFSFQINFFLKPMAFYKLKLMRNQFNTFIYQNMKPEVFQLGVKNGLFYAKDKALDNFLDKIFLVLPNEQSSISISAKKSKFFLNKKEGKVDLVLKLYSGKIYDLLGSNPFVYSFDKVQILLQSLAPISIKPNLKYYTLLDLNAAGALLKNKKKILIYKYKAINLVLSCLSFSLLAWILLPMNFIRKKQQSIIAFIIVSVFWLLYSLSLSWAQGSGLSLHIIYIIPNLWIFLICLIFYKSKKNTPLSTRMLSF